MHMLLTCSPVCVCIRLPCVCSICASNILPYVYMLISYAFHLFYVTLYTLYPLYIPCIFPKPMADCICLQIVHYILCMWFYVACPLCMHLCGYDILPCAYMHKILFLASIVCDRMGILYMPCISVEPMAMCICIWIVPYISSMWPYPLYPLCLMFSLLCTNMWWAPWYVFN